MVTPRVRLYLGRRHDRIGEAIASVVADRGFGLLALFWLAAGCALTMRKSRCRRTCSPRPWRSARRAAGYLASPLIARLTPRLRAAAWRAASASIAPYLR